MENDDIKRKMNTVEDDESMVDPYSSKERDRLLREGYTGSFDRPTANKTPDDKDLPWYKRKFVRKLRYALIALLIALTLWGYVLMSENPVRIKKVEDVRLSFAGGNEADLASRKLIISGDIDQILHNVTVNVRTTLNDLPRFNSSVGDIVTATINLSDIREPGTYVRRIYAATTIGTVESVEPATITITVESLVERQVPVNCVLVNELPEGYWHDDPTILDRSIKISGPESIVSNIVKANCIIDLTDRTTSLNETVDAVFLDKNDNVIDADELIDSAYSAGIKLTILPYVDIPLADYITSIGELNEDFEISSTSINPGYLSIAAPQATLDYVLSSVSFEPINYSDFTAPGTYTQKVSLMGLPSDVILLNDNNFLITIEVVDRIISKRFTKALTDDEIIGMNTANFNYQFPSRNVVVEMTGPVRLIKNITENSFTLNLDLTNSGLGVHNLTPVLRVNGDPAWVDDGSVEISISSIVCAITNK